MAKRALQPWTLPDSSVLQLIQDLYFEKQETPTLNGASCEFEKLNQLDRKSLCQLLEQKVVQVIDMFKTQSSSMTSKVREGEGDGDGAAAAYVAEPSILNPVLLAMCLLLFLYSILVQIWIELAYRWLVDFGCFECVF